jgi:hypothetical protein
MRLAVLCAVFMAVVSAVAVIWLQAVIASQMPGPDPEKVWEYITKTSPYREWPSWPDYEGMQKSRSPHGDQNRVFVNKTLFEAKSAPAPHGSIQVKESYDADGKLLNITLMYKAKDYNPEAGDWLWAKYDLDGQAEIFGAPKGCIACHGVKADNDYILVHTF